MHSVLHIERRDAAPGTPTSNHLWDSQLPGSASRQHNSSHKKLSLSALKSPFKSLRSRRKSHNPSDQSPASAKHNQSLFSLFHSSRSRCLNSTETLKEGIVAERPKTVSPSKNRVRDSEHLVGLPNRSKSFGDLFGVFSSSHASKYNTGSRRVHGHPNISHHSGPLHSTVPPNNRNLDGTSAFWDADKLAAWKQQQRRIQDLEAEMDAFWRLEQVIENFEEKQAKSALEHTKECASSTGSWGSSAQTLHSAEGARRDRAMPKYEQVDDSITYRPYSERPSLCSRPSPSILIGERNYSAGVGNNASIAERIQLTVDEMIKTRYLNSSINSLDHEVMDPALDESLHARMNPDVACPRSDATKSKSSETINAQPSIIPNGLAPVDGQKHPTKSDITCSKTRVEVKKPRPCSKRIRQVSIAPVRVEFPHTNTQPAYVGIYESISKAIADIFEKNHGQLSSICAYGRESRIIQVYPGERAPNSHEIRQRGLETIWLPLQDKSGSRALLDAMLSDELLVQSNCPSSPSNSSSPTKSGSVQKRSPMAEVSLNKASKPTRETPAKPPVESALEGNKNGPNVAMRPNIDTVTASEYMSYGDTWDSEDGSVLKLDTESDLENSLMSYSSRGTEEHNKITIDNQRELGGTSLQQYPAGVDQIISSCKIDRGKVRTQQRDTLRLSHKIQYSVHKGGEEMEARRCDLPLAKGFPFTAYAVQLLEHSDSCESAQCPDNMNHNQENELLQLLGSPSGLKPKHRKDRKIDQLNIPGTTQSKRQRQCATTSTTLRNGRSKFASLHLESKSDAESDRKPCNPGISDKLLADSVTILHGRSSCDYAHNGQGLSSLIQGEGKKVSGLVEIFQARGMICPDIVLGSQGTSLMSKPAHARGDHLSAPATRICTTPNSPSDTVVSPSGATSNPLSRPSSLNRVPTRHSVSTRPDSRLSTAITEASSTFGEQLETFEREAEEEGELHFPDSVVCE